MARYLYSEIASVVQARLSCAQMFCITCNRNLDGYGSCITGHEVKRNNPEWFDKHSERIEQLVRNYLPSGSGFDNGTTLDLNASHADKLVFCTAYHHMVEGYYDGWTEHTVTVTPAFNHFHLRVSGRNRNDIKDYIADVFGCALQTELQEVAQ